MKEYLKKIGPHLRDMADLKKPGLWNIYLPLKPKSMSYRDSNEKTCNVF